MKTKSLFLTFLFSVLLPLTICAGEATDSWNSTSMSGKSIGTYSPSVIDCPSGAVYAGEFRWVRTYMQINSTQFFVTTESPGTAKSVSVTWRTSGNTAGTTQIIVYGQNSPYTGGESATSMTGDPIGSTTYSGVAGPSNIALSGEYEYIAIVATGTTANLTRLDVVWTVPDVTKYTITSDVTGVGDVFFEPDEPDFAPGTEVTVYFIGDGTELRNFSISDVIETDWGEDDFTDYYEYTFEMPESDVTIEAIFDVAPSREENIISINGIANTYSTTIQSGVSSDLIITTNYYTGTTPSYDKTLKSVVSSNTGVVQVVGNTYSASAGSGTLTLRGVSTGSAKVTIETYQTNGVYRSTRDINVTVIDRDVAIVTELHGKYYALPNSISGTTASAQELIKEGSNYYYKTDVALSDITWKMADANIAGTKFYIKNSSGNYLTIDAATMSLESSAFQWSLNSDGYLITGYLTGICYDEDRALFLVKNEDVHRTNTAVSHCAFEVNIANLLPAKEYTRTLTVGNFATMCLPYNVPSSATFFDGVTAFNITGKHMTGATITGIELEEVEGTLVPGKPYIIQASAAKMSVWHGDSEVDMSVSAVGLVGNLGSSYAVPVGCYVLSSNKIRKVVYAGTANVGQYRAYLNLDDVPEVVGSPAPGRRVLYVEDTGTSVENLLENATLINWNEPVYNMLGQQVGKGTTGVLIQNGQKFLVQ